MRLVTVIVLALICASALAATSASSTGYAQPVYHDLTIGSSGASGYASPISDAPSSSSSTGTGYTQPISEQATSSTSSGTPVAEDDGDAVETADVETCVWPAHYWLTHLHHQAWTGLQNCSLCGLSCQSAARGVGTIENYDAQGHEAAVQVVSAMLDAVANGCMQMDQCLPLEAWQILVALEEQGCVETELPEDALGTLTLRNNGADPDGPCACTDLSCARYVFPQALIDEQNVAIRKLSKAEQGFLAWAIVMTVVAVVLLVILLFLAFRIEWGKNAGHPMGFGGGVVGTVAVSDDMSDQLMPGEAMSAYSTGNAAVDQMSL